MLGFHAWLCAYGITNHIMMTCFDFFLHPAHLVCLLDYLIVKSHEVVWYGLVKWKSNSC